VLSDTVIILTDTTTTFAASVSPLGSIHVYPNPFTQELTVCGAAQGDEILLMDMTGRSLLHLTATQKEPVLDTKILANGCYLLKCFSKEGKLKETIPVVKR
jgi:hypothetical protein